MQVLLKTESAQTMVETIKITTNSKLALLSVITVIFMMFYLYQSVKVSKLFVLHMESICLNQTTSLFMLKHSGS